MNRQLTYIRRTVSMLLLMVASFSFLQAQQPLITVTGTVTDENNEPLIGAAIVVIGKSDTGTITNVDGKYTIKVPSRARLMFSFIGYVNKEVAVAGKTRIAVKMEPVATALDEVVIVGYGTQRKVDVTGAVISIKGEELARMPTASVIEALSGKIPGLQVVSSTEPGSTSTVRIRGVGTFSNAAPICVIDGRFAELNALSEINQNDIEELTVLKDASATAIYGSRGANGVIIVNTKVGSGKEGQVRVNAGAYFSISEMERTLDLANLSEWQQIENLRFLADNYRVADAENSLPYPNWRSAGKGTDWQDVVSRKGFSQNYNISIGGSTPKADYYIGAAYLSQEGVVQHSDFDRLSVSMNMVYKPFRWLRLGVNSTYTYNNRINVEGNVLQLAGKRSPDAPIYNDAENSDENDFNGGDSNPYALLHYTHDRYNKTNQYNTLAYLEISFLKNLKLKSSFSYSTLAQEEKKFLPAFMENVENSSSPYKTSRFYHNTVNNSSWLQENILTYSKIKGEHRFNAMGGATFQMLRTQFVHLNAANLPWAAWKNRNLWYVGQGQNITGSDGGSEKTYVSFLARIGYTFKNRYTLNVTGRADGSSAYPSNNQFGLFPSVGLGWYLSEEEFMKELSWIDHLKLRASYGVVGNDKGVSAAQALYASTVDVVMGPDNTPVKADALKLMMDESLTWEEARTLNVGFESSFRKNLFNFSFEFYDKLTSNVMMPLSIPPSNISIISNIGKVRNRGVELSFTYAPSIGKVKTSFMMTATTLDNKVTEIERQIGAITNLPNQTLEGYPIGSLWGYQTIGVFQNEQELAQMSKVNGTRVGDLMFKDQNRDGYIDSSDYVYLGSYLPKALLGCNANATWKGISLRVELNASVGQRSFNQRERLRMSNQNASRRMLSAWHGEGTSYTHPRVFDRNHASAQISDYFIENCDYISIANVQFAYTFPKHFTRKFKVNNLRIYVNGSNLYTLTEATGYKPDIETRGANANLGGLDDFGLYPNNRTYTAGFSATF